MNIIDSPLHELPWFDTAAADIAGGRSKLSLTGAADSGKLHIISALSGQTDVTLILTYSDIVASQIADEYRFFDRNTCYYPAKDLIFYQADINGRETLKERLKVLRTLLTCKKMTIVTTFNALMETCLPLEVIKDHIFEIEKGTTLEEEAAAVLLTSMGYERTGYQVQNPGEFSIRGGIIDIFDMTGENPVRVELWGDTVESLRSFDADSQRSIEELEKVTIFPADEMLLSKEEKLEGFRKIKEESETQEKILREKFSTEEAHRLSVRLEELENALVYGTGDISLDSYIHYFYPSTISLLDLIEGKKYCVFLDEPSRIMEFAHGIEMEFAESMKNRLEGGYVLPGQTDILTSADSIRSRLSRENTVQIQSFEPAEDFFENEKRVAVNMRTLSSYNGKFEVLTDNLGKLAAEGYRIVILSGSRSRAKRLADDISEEGLAAYYTDNEGNTLVPRQIATFYGRVKKGFTYPDLKFTVISETDIFGADRLKKKKKKPKYAPGKKIRNLTDLHAGDYVINEDCGVGIYRGIEEVEVDHIRKDYMKIEYRGGSFLYVAATAFDKVSLYADKEARPPKLNKLGTDEWNHAKAKAKKAVDDIAQDLVDLYAVRMQKTGYRYGADTIWQKEFEEMFPYQETDDQISAIDAVKEDMESTKIMDRLVCGDVGFGKTEVAIRAAFKAVQENKQVAYLVPTTILAEQHFNTFSERMRDYPVSVEMISRFRTPAQIKDVIKRLREGTVDIVIGTHRLLSKDVQFRDLGLLVIDEEQRFGVAHKEKIKQLKQNVDVLTLTATPIPRTLHMSLAGIRDMSLLEEPPRNRQPIQTFICEYNDEMVREAINREMSRGGQVYYVHNRINNIDEITREISELVPSARVAFAHGRMGEKELEDIMMSFIRKEIDVLVSTTIIETGLDIPNVNTMIIRDSDRMGLAQLYQLRGRVGREERTAYAFLMYDRNKILRETAEKRLSAIKQYTELGSGFKIAMSDLEIRGAGNVLGKQQHGQVEAIGYDLYCRMLESAIKEKRGIKVAEDTSCEIDMSIDAFIPAEFIMNETQKLDIYKRIAEIKNDEDADEMRDELKDRFGSIPQEAENLLKIALLKAKAGKYHITSIHGKDGVLNFKMDRKAPAEVTEIPVLLNSYGGDMRLKTVGDPVFSLSLRESGGLYGSALMLKKADETLDSFGILFPERSDS